MKIHEFKNITESNQHYVESGVEKCGVVKSYPNPTQCRFPVSTGRSNEILKNIWLQGPLHQ
jgi:hypothetical protein